MLWDALLGLQLPNRVPVQPKTHRWGGGVGEKHVNWESSLWVLFYREALKSKVETVVGALLVAQGWPRSLGSRD